MRRYRAAWILPIASPPVQRGFVRVAQGRVLETGPQGRDRGEPPLAADETVVDLGDAAVLPGLVNAHTHLELSWMRGRIPPTDSMPGWARRLIELRLDAGSDDEAAITAAVREARAAGTALVGDVGNTLASVPVLDHEGLAGVVFHELIKFREERAADLVREARDRLARLPESRGVTVTLAAHAPYSVAPGLFRAIRDTVAPSDPWAVHLGESREEVEFLLTGTGGWRDLLEQLGAWSDAWTVPGCGPAAYLDRLGVLDDRLVAAHAVQLPDSELRLLRDRGVTVVTCPRSNGWTGAGPPPIDRFHASGVRIAVGTDSLASAPDLNVFAELAELRRLSPRIPARTILDWATREGARALRRDADFGTLAPGRRAAIIAVAAPPGLRDVEEYLVDGVTPAQVSWVDSCE